jgi:1-deoxy-D-xylulose-5-phosphate reductoisomerase
MKLQSLTILGSTGSIGQSTLDVVLRHPDRFRVHALSAHQRVDVLLEQSRLVRPDCVVLPDDQTAQRFKSLLGPSDHHPEVRVGPHALSQTAADHQTDVVMAAIVGIAGLPAAIAAANAGKRILLANKEALVAAGSLFMAAVRHHQAELLPIDSEHNAIFQCLPHTSQASAPIGPAPGVARILLTASGGPFRQTPLAELAQVTPAQACAHPNWRMGRKISVDSATMLNKGLEVIEAHWLFAMPATRIDVVIHPQSVVHSMVQYDDGSVLAQLGQPDMRTPIAYGLGFPERIAAGVSMLDLVQVAKLDFEAVDAQRYPCLDLAYEALAAGQASCIALNAANEVAVQAFLDGLIAYPDIVSWIRDALNWQAGQSSVSVESLDDVLAIDQACRTFLNARCPK